MASNSGTGAGGNFATGLFSVFSNAFGGGILGALGKSRHVGQKTVAEKSAHGYRLYGGQPFGPTLYGGATAVGRTKPLARRFDFKPKPITTHVDWGAPTYKESTPTNTAATVQTFEGQQNIGDLETSTAPEFKGLFKDTTPVSDAKRKKPALGMGDYSL